jgi:hypothetical protein
MPYAEADNRCVDLEHQIPAPIKLLQRAAHAGLKVGAALVVSTTVPHATG